MNWEALIAVSEKLAQVEHISDSDVQTGVAQLNKAVSVAYYAMFHALAQNNADRLVGDSESDGETVAWHRIYRALEHRTAYRQLSESRLGNFSDQVRRFGSTFRDLQDSRHRADYDPQSYFARTETLNLIAEAESAIRDFLTATIAERRDLAAHVLFTSRG
ncbi:MAG: hypothetical protein J4G13_04260 [Dehalococcoidia bacterium]|nr:hypothetical protein [Dehalococcoidia bacterium]